MLKRVRGVKLFEDDVDLWFGVLVTFEQAVYVFDFSVEPTIDQAQIVDWRNRTGQWDGFPHAAAIREAMRILESRTT